MAAGVVVVGVEVLLHRNVDDPHPHLRVEQVGCEA